MGQIAPSLSRTFEAIGFDQMQEESIWRCVGQVINHPSERWFSERRQHLSISDNLSLCQSISNEEHFVNLSLNQEAFEESCY